MTGYHLFKDETIIGLADEARRLGNVEGELTTAQMKEIFESVNVEGDSSGTVDTTNVLWRWWSGTINVNETPFTVTYNLTNTKTSNYNQIAALNEPYIVTLTPDYGEIISVTVLMGDEDVTDDVFDNGVINIPCVTGDIVIAAYSGYIVADGYVGVQYVEATGTQYIDSGFKLTQNNKVDIKFTASGNSAIFGSRENADSNNIGIAYSSGVIVVDFHNSANGPYRLIEQIQSGDVYRVVCSKDGRFIYASDGGLLFSNTTVCNDNIITPDNAYLFNMSYNANGWGGLNGRIYYCKVYENDLLVYEFVPAIRVSDNVIGMYDLVNGVFYMNAGSGTFLYA